VFAIALLRAGDPRVGRAHERHSEGVADTDHSVDGFLTDGRVPHHAALAHPLPSHLELGLDYRQHAPGPLQQADDRRQDQAQGDEADVDGDQGVGPAGLGGVQLADVGSLQDADPRIGA